MFIGITLELENGEEASIRFGDTRDSAAVARCETSKGCAHEIAPDRVPELFRAIDIFYDGDALKSVREVVRKKKAEALFHALHTSPSFLDNPRFLLCPPTWTHESTKELLELYLTGFAPSMLASHFRLSAMEIIEQLSSVVFGDHHLTKDPTKARHQRTWHRDEVLFLASQMQVGRTPTEIAALMDRDSLGIAFKLFQALPVPIPRAVLEEYDIDARQEPLGDVPLDGKPF